jgi:hypothetical protein
MGRAIMARDRWVQVLALGAVLGAACGEDGVAVTDSASGTESSGGTTDTSPTTTQTTVPTTTVPTTTDSSATDGTGTGTDTTPTTTSPVTTTDTDTTTGTTDTTTGTTDTTTDSTTGTTTGGELVGRSVSQTVNGGTVASSTNFRMVFTLGQPTQSQGVYTSNNFRLQGGLIGANGNPP